MRLLHLGSFDFKVLSHLIIRQLEIALLSIGAGDGNRTHVFSLEGCCTTIVLHPHPPFWPARVGQIKKLVERAGFEPANSKEDRFTVCWL